jgi:hypothetical protein
VTSERREVDVVIRSSTAGYPLVVSIEATSTGRRADVSWVEKMRAKHEHLETNQFVLVSESGFSDQASKLAEHRGILPVTPVDLEGGNPDAEIVGNLPALWPKLLSMTVESIKVHVLRPDGEEVWFKAEPDHTLFVANGTPIKKQNGWGDMPDAEYLAERDSIRAALAALLDNDRIRSFDAYRARVLELPQAIAVASPRRREKLCRIVVERVVIRDRRLNSIVWTPPVRPFFEKQRVCPQGDSNP